MASDVEVDDAEGPPYPCPDCGELFLEIGPMRGHYSAVHEQFGCDADGCNRRFKTKRGLGIHRTKTHDSEDDDE